MDKSKIIAHLVTLAKADKQYAWWAAKNYSVMLPEWVDLPAVLTGLMQEHQKK